MAIENYLTTQEAAEILGVSDIRVRQFVREGRFRDVKPQGRMIFIGRGEVEKFSRLDRPRGRPRKSEKR